MKSASTLMPTFCNYNYEAVILDNQDKMYYYCKEKSSAGVLDVTGGSSWLNITSITKK